MATFHITWTLYADDDVIQAIEAETLDAAAEQAKRLPPPPWWQAPEYGPGTEWELWEYDREQVQWVLEIPCDGDCEAAFHDESRKHHYALITVRDNNLHPLRPTVEGQAFQILRRVEYGPAAYEEYVVLLADGRRLTVKPHAIFADVEPHEHEWRWSRGCGTEVCITCGEHRGLAWCFCGWSESGGDGYRELVESGEWIEEDY